MMIEAHASTDLHQLRKSIATASVVMLTNVDADGAFLTRPMAPLEMDGNGGLWFFTDLRARAVDHTRVANVSFTDASQGIRVSLSGRCEIDTDRARIARLWASFAKPASTTAPDSENLALLKFVPDSAARWNQSQGGMTHMFAHAAAASGDQIVASDQDIR